MKFKSIHVALTLLIAFITSMSFTEKNSKSLTEDLRLDLPESSIQYTSGGDVVETVFTAMVQTPEMESARQMSFVICPGTGERCNLIYVDANDNTIVVSAYKTAGGAVVSFY